VERISLLQDRHDQPGTRSFIVLAQSTEPLALSPGQFMADKFNLIVETRHAPDNGHQENIHNLPPDLLAKRQIEYIDIVKDVVEPKDYNEATDPAKYLSVKTGRGHLKPDWREKVIGTEAPEGYTQLAMKNKD